MVFERPDQRLAHSGIQSKLVVVGGAGMVLLHRTRESTKDIDGVILLPEDRSAFRDIIKRVSSETGLPEDWFNDAEKGYLSKIDLGEIL